ncbi:22470_t:CDS:1, partial [Gigaspora rosea]
ANPLESQRNNSKSSWRSILEPDQGNVLRPSQENIPGETAVRNLRHANIGDVRTWVKNSWEGISNEIIVESFETCKFQMIQVNRILI